MFHKQICYLFWACSCEFREKSHSENVLYSGRKGDLRLFSTFVIRFW